MKKITKAAASLAATCLLALLFFFGLVVPARAPHGGKKSLGGRTIASLQEQDFDHKLLRFQLCYGVRFQAESSTLERRRVCKALLVHQLSQALHAPGAYFRSPIHFRCEDTAFLRKPADENTAVNLRPNKEFVEINRIIRQELEREPTLDADDAKAKLACDLLTDCKWAMRTLSLRKLLSCFTTRDIAHRKILVDEVGAMLFHAKSGESKILYSELLQEARKSP